MNKQKIQALYLFAAGASLAITGCGSSGSNNDKADSQPPQFKSASALQVMENSSGVIYTAEATSTDDQEISFKLLEQGDAALFTLNATSGALEFNNTPDFEAAQDANQDNIYSLVLEATSEQGLTSQLPLDIEVTNQDQPVFHINFPSANSNFGGATQTALFKGHISDSEDGIASFDSIKSFTANGQSIIESLDNKNQWQITLPVNTDGLTVNFQLEDNQGNLQQQDFNIHNRPVFSESYYSIYDQQGNTAYLFDRSSFSLFKYQFEDQQLKLISPNTNEYGPRIFEPEHVILDSEQQQLVIAFARDHSGASCHTTLMTLDLVSGQRTLIDTQTEESACYYFRQGIALDNQTHELIAITENEKAVKINLDDMSSTILTAASYNDKILAFDSQSKTLILSQDYPHKIVLATEDSSKVYTTNNQFEHTSYDPLENKLYALTKGRRLVSFDLKNLPEGDSIDETEIISFGEEAPHQVYLAADNQLMLTHTSTDPYDTIASYYFNDFSSLDLTSKDITPIQLQDALSEQVGQATHKVNAVVDKHQDKLYYLSLVDLESLPATEIKAINLKDGSIEKIYTAVANPESPQTSLIGNIAWHNNLIYFTQPMAETLVQLNPETGETQLVSGQQAGSGAPLHWPVAISIDSENNTAYITGYVRSSQVSPVLPMAKDIKARRRDEILYVMKVDLTTGARTMISDQHTGVGPLLEIDNTTLFAQTIDLDNQKLYLQSENTISVVDLTSGNREILYNAREFLVKGLMIDKFSSGYGISGLTLDIEKQQLYFIEDNVIYRHDLQSRQNQKITRDNFLPYFYYPLSGRNMLGSLYFDQQQRLLYFSDSSDNSIKMLDPETGTQVFLINHSSNSSQHIIGGDY